jgi:hypothetical protein
MQGEKPSLASDTSSRSRTTVAVIASIGVCCLGVAADLAGITNFLTGKNAPQIVGGGPRDELPATVPDGTSAKPSEASRPTDVRMAPPANRSVAPSATPHKSGDERTHVSGPVHQQSVSSHPSSSARPRPGVPANDARTSGSVSPSASASPKKTARPSPTVFLVSMSCERNPSGADGVYIKYRLAGADGATARVTVTINGTASHTDNFTWPAPGQEGNFQNGSYGVIYNADTAGHCDLNATTSSGQIQTARDSN